MIKYATRFQLAIYLQRGYDLICFNSAKDWWGLYLKAPNYQNKFKTRLAASGTKAELEALVKEYAV